MRRTMLVAACVAALGFTACGDDDDSGDSAAAPAAAEATTTQAKATVEPPPTSPPTEIPVSEPLTQAPGKKTAIFLQCQLPICKRFTTGFQEAIKTIGWKGDVQVLDNTKPGESLQQAVQQKPDFIAMTGIPGAAIKQQLAAAQKAGIPVMSCGDTTPPEEGGYAVQCGSTHAPNAEMIGHWIANDAGGPAKVLTVNISAFGQITTEVEWYEQNFADLCDGCAVEKLDVTLEDVGAGKVPQQIVAAIQRDPDINYVHFTFADLSVNVPQALESAGMADKVKLVGVANDQNVVKGIADGKIAAWTMEPVEFGSWIMVDAMARLAAGQELDADYHKSVEVLPSWVLQDKAQAQTISAEGGNWTGPEGSAAQFAELWKVGS